MRARAPPAAAAAHTLQQLAMAAEQVAAGMASGDNSLSSIDVCEAVRVFLELHGELHEPGDQQLAAGAAAAANEEPTEDRTKRPRMTVDDEATALWFSGYTAPDGAAAPPTPGRDQGCDVHYWTNVDCSRGGGNDATRRNWYILMNYIQTNGSPCKYWQREAGHEWTPDGQRLVRGGALVSIGSPEGCVPNEHTHPNGTVEDVFRHAQRRTANGHNQGMLICDADGLPITVQVRLRERSGAGADPTMRVCANCFRHLIYRHTRDVRKYVRLPRTAQQPTLLEELVTMHEAVMLMRGERPSYEECLATVRAEHPRWRRYTRDLALDHEDMSILALRCRVDYHRRMLEQASEALAVAETTIIVASLTD